MLIFGANLILYMYLPWKLDSRYYHDGGCGWGRVGSLQFLHQGQRKATLKKKGCKAKKATNWILEFERTLEGGRLHRGRL